MGNLSSGAVWMIHDFGGMDYDSLPSGVSHEMVNPIEIDDCPSFTNNLSVKKNQTTILSYPLVIQHNYGKSPFFHMSISYVYGHLYHSYVSHNQWVSLTSKRLPGPYWAADVPAFHGATRVICFFGQISGDSVRSSSGIFLGWFTQGGDFLWNLRFFSSKSSGDHHFSHEKKWKPRCL